MRGTALRSGGHHFGGNHQTLADALERYDAELLGVLPKDVLALIRQGDQAWEALVPDAAVDTIKEKHLFRLSRVE